MSHITEVKTKVSLKNREWVKGACELLKAQVKGLTYEETATKFTIRYKPIEVFQSNGNLRFTQQSDGSFKMESDRYHCDKETREIENAFTVAYQQYGVNAFFSMDGYQMENTKAKDGKVLVTATRY